MKQIGQFALLLISMKILSFVKNLKSLHESYFPLVCMKKYCL